MHAYILILIITTSRAQFCQTFKISKKLKIIFSYIFILFCIIDELLLYLKKMHYKTCQLSIYFKGVQITVMRNKIFEVMSDSRLKMADTCHLKALDEILFHSYISLCKHHATESKVIPAGDISFINFYCMNFQIVVLHQMLKQ